VEAFLVSTVVVGLAEIGDKTQILALMLAARFLRPVPIIFGIFFATIANHAAAGLAGTFFGDVLGGPWMRWILGLSFLSVAIWALFPDKYKVATRLSADRGRSPPRSVPFSSRKSAIRRKSRRLASPHASNSSIRWSSAPPSA
jgi:putative Ca2+/H+ antiporter (TMEM165/GDT1 family)